VDLRRGGEDEGAARDGLNAASASASNSARWSSQPNSDAAVGGRAKDVAVLTVVAVTLLPLLLLPVPLLLPAPPEPVGESQTPLRPLLVSVAGFASLYVGLDGLGMLKACGKYVSDHGLGSEK